jgi:hypothetical protein
MHPAQTATEYCDDAAKSKFFAVAALLRKRALPVADDNERKALRRGEVPFRFWELIETAERDSKRETPPEESPGGAAN